MAINISLQLPDDKLKFKDFRTREISWVESLKLLHLMMKQGFEVVSHLQFYNGISKLKEHGLLLQTTVKMTLPFEYVSSFALTGIEKEGLLPLRTRKWLCVYVTTLGRESCNGRKYTPSSAWY